MVLIKLTRHSDEKLYAKTIEVIVEKDFRSFSICIDNFSNKRLKEAISDKAKTLGANAYEYRGSTLWNWNGQYCGSYKFYKIDKSALKIKKDEQLKFDF